MTRLLARLERSALRPADLLADFTAGLSEEGAVVSFVGLTRPRDAAGRPVEALFLDSYPGMTEESLARIGQDALDRFDVGAVAIVHRCGRLEPNEPIVFAAAASVHRRAAFEAADYLMDRLKTEAVLWKREDGPHGSRWIEPTDGDHADRARWSDACPE